MITNKSWLKKFCLTFFFVLLLVSCNSATNIYNRQDSFNSKLSGTIIFWQSYPEKYMTKALIEEYKKGINQYIQKFTKLYPETKIIVEFAREETLVEQVNSEIKKGLGPDLIFTRSFNIIPLLKINALIPIDEYSIDLLQFRPEALVQVLRQGKLYGIPINLDTQVLCYNKDKVNTIPETLSELIIQARKGYSVGMLSNFEDTFWGANIFNGQLLNTQGEIDLGKENGWAKWMEWLKKAKNEPNFILNEDSLVLQNAFSEGKLAFNICRSEQIPFLRKSLGADKFGIALLPGENSNKSAPFLFTNSFVFSSMSSKNQTRIALKLAQFLTNIQSQTEITAKFRAFIPASKNAVVNPNLFPIQDILQKQSKTGIAYSLDQAEKVGVTINYGKDFYTRVISGEISSQQAAQELAKIINLQFQSPSSSK